MGKKMRKSLLNEANCPVQTMENMINLDSSCDTDIIECSIVDENGPDFLKKVKYPLKKPNDSQSPKTPVQNKQLKNLRSGNIKDSDKALRISLRKSYRLSDDKVSGETAAFQTPNLVKNGKQSNSLVKKMISTLKKTPDGGYLSVSKLRNIEQWLRENDVETVRTPPFANLSVTPMRSLKKRLSSRWKDENVKPEDSSMDSEVEGVLKAVYGDDWHGKNNGSRCKTEPKKRAKRFSSPASQTKKKGVAVFHSVRRNILNEKKLNAVEVNKAENNFDDSFLSGIRMINLDVSDCDEGRIKANVINTIGSEKQCEGDDSCFEPLSAPPSRKKKQTAVPSKVVENGKGVSKSSSDKKCPPNAAFKTPKKTFLASLSVSTPTSRCHPDAQYYKINFKSKKEELVKKLYKLYNGEVFDWKLAEDMSFSWNVKLRGTAGYCYNKRVTKSTGEVIRQSRIEFSTKIVDRADRLRDTMIHELCHAASWVIDGVLDGHGDVWSRWASRVADRFPELPAIKRCHNYDIVSKYVYRCTGCGYSIKRHSKSINTERKRCGHCYGVLELLINKKRKGKGEVPEFDTTRTLPTPNKFALFVKENYHSIKSTKGDAKHSEIMKILSEKYAFLKSGSKSVKKSHE